MKLMRLPEVMKQVGLKKTAIYDRIKSKAFPAPVKLGGASTWPEHEITAWIQTQISQSRPPETGTNAA